MKAKISLAAVVMAGFILFAACGSTGGGTTTSAPAQSAAYSSGQQVGSSLLGLYQQYKSTGKIDFKNVGTYAQILTLAANVETIKANAKNASFYSQFTQGAIIGSQQTVNSSNVSGVMSLLQGLNLTGITSAGSGSNVSVSAASTALNSLTALFGLLGK